MAHQLHFQFDPHSGVPVYRQLMDQIKYYVASGTLSSGDQLPSIRELAQSLAVNPTTIVKTFNELVHEGVVELRHGKGAFIAQRSEDISIEEGEKSMRRLARQLAVEASQMKADRNRVLEIVDEELTSMAGEAVGGRMPVKLRVVSKISGR